MRATLVAALAAACAATLAAQHYEHPLPADFDEPIALYKIGLGRLTRPISSKHAEAQAYFSQGLQLMYGFAKVEAGRSFREAQKRAPDCAICYWGEAWAWGPYVNGRMTAAHAERAYAAVQKAVARAEAHASVKEQALIRAMSERYGERFDAARQADRDRAYADEMARVAASYPDDLDVTDSPRLPATQRGSGSDLVFQHRNIRQCRKARSDPRATSRVGELHHHFFGLKRQAELRNVEKQDQTPEGPEGSARSSDRSGSHLVFQHSDKTREPRADDLSNPRRRNLYLPPLRFVLACRDLRSSWEFRR